MKDIKEKTSDAIEIIHNRYFKGKPDRMAGLEEERIHLDVACKIYERRERAGLSQEELAKLVEVSPSVLSSLENADYEGDSISLYQRIASVLEKRRMI